MPNRTLRASVLCAGLIAAAAAASAHGQDVTTPAAAGPHYAGHAVTITTLSEQPGAIAVDGQGNLYVVTNGLAHLTDAVVLELKPGARKFTRAALFHNTAPSSVSVDGDGDIFAQADDMFAQTDTTIEEVARGSSTVTTVATMPSGIASVANPILVDSHGTIFTTTGNALAALFDRGSPGSVYEISKGMHSATCLLTVKGSAFDRLAVDSFNDIFVSALTFSGPLKTPTTRGAVYEIPAGNGKIIPLPPMPGNTPLASMVSDSSGDLYGAAGSSAQTIYELPHGSISYIKIASCGALEPGNLLVDSRGDIFGTETSAEPDSGKPGAKDWSVFEVAAGTHLVKTLANFTKNTPVALALDSSGNIFGATDGDDPNFIGTVFEIAANDPALAPVPSPSPEEDDREEAQQTTQIKGQEAAQTAQVSALANSPFVRLAVLGAWGSAVTLNLPPESGAPPLPNAAWLTAILQKASDADAASAQELLAQGTDPKSAASIAALSVACGTGDSAVALALIGAGTDVNAICPQQVQDLLGISVNEPMGWVFKWPSIPEGFDVADGMTPLMYASYSGSLAVVNALLIHGARVNTQDTLGMTALAYAASTGQTSVVNTLLTHGAKPNTQSTDGLTPLMELAARPDKLVTPYGIFYAELPRPMAYASNRHDKAVIAGMNAKLAHYKATHAADYAPMKREEEAADSAIAQALLTHAATLRAHDSHGNTALTLAQHHDRPALAHLLAQAMHGAPGTTKE